MYLASPGLPTDIGYSWAMPAILVAGKGRGGIFFISSVFFTLIPVPLSSLSLSFISSTVSSISFLSFSGKGHKMTTRADMPLNPNTIHQSAENVTQSQVAQSAKH